MKPEKKPESRLSARDQKELQYFKKIVTAANASCVDQNIEFLRQYGKYRVSRYDARAAVDYVKKLLA